MRLLLKRRYTPRGSLGRLYLGQKQLCFIREAPKSCYDQAIHCLEEGTFELEAAHSEEEGWFIRVGERGLIKARKGESRPGLNELCPVTSYRADGTSLFTKLAFLKLMDELTPFWERGEILDLQIVSTGIPYQLESCLEQSYS
ncbi:hypothetical protein [Algoriphagus pacificus]|uniref:DUF5675 domain-containing protein n=1 Tax=Algoriphagus pacificus TaxID=2811234 RepID=A0ABS3CIB9_9BACT|nr:hypothetical protein [Algoriphagus pacificus]MBN7816269.1 hypothetical protein [Algoriphagus pacificus]